MKHLYISGGPPQAFLERVKASRPRVLPNEQVQPHSAVPGSPGRILAYGEPPFVIREGKKLGFASDYALVTENTSDAGLDAALSHVLGLVNHPKGVSMAQWLSTTAGAEVREVVDGPSFR